MKKFSLLMITAFFLFAAHAQTSTTTLPRSADEIVKEACQLAGKEKKNVLLMFHASWCVWCHRMDSSLNDPSCKKYFDDNFVITHLVVYESDDKKNLENPAALEMLTRYNGQNQGIPFWLVLDKDGNLIGDSQIRPEGSGFDVKGTNMGCPASEKEVEAFVALLKKTTKLSVQQEAAIVKRFRKNEMH